MLAYYELGQNPIEEAVRLQNLYQDSGIDDRILEEFGSTVNAYQSLVIDAVAERIEEKYASASAALGMLAVLDGTDIGAAIVCHKAYATTNGTSGTGINGSGWILQQYRGYGYSKEFASSVLQKTFERRENPLLAYWHHADVWTSIHHQNAASIATAVASGMVAIGPAANDPARTIYLLET